MAKLGFTKNKSSQLVEALFETIKARLQGGEDVLIPGFGKFPVKEKNSRRGRNPQTGEDLTLGASRIVTFRCSGMLRGRVNGKSD